MMDRKTQMIDGNRALIEPLTWAKSFELLSGKSLFELLSGKSLFFALVDKLMTTQQYASSRGCYVLMARKQGSW